MVLPVTVISTRAFIRNERARRCPRTPPLRRTLPPSRAVVHAVSKRRRGGTDIEKSLAFRQLLGEHRRTAQHAGDDHQHGGSQKNACFASHLFAGCLVDGGKIKAVHPRRPRQDLESGAPFPH